MHVGNRHALKTLWAPLSPGTRHACQLCQHPGHKASDDAGALLQWQWGFGRCVAFARFPRFQQITRESEEGVLSSIGVARSQGTNDLQSGNGPNANMSLASFSVGLRSAGAKKCRSRPSTLSTGDARVGCRASPGSLRCAAGFFNVLNFVHLCLDRPPAHTRKRLFFLAMPCACGFSNKNVRQLPG